MNASAEQRFAPIASRHVKRRRTRRNHPHHLRAAVCIERGPNLPPSARRIRAPGDRSPGRALLQCGQDACKEFGATGAGLRLLLPENQAGRARRIGQRKG